MKVHYKIIEGKTERVQVFEGIVIAMKRDGLRKTFTVRKISYGVGVERIFPLHSPKIAKIVRVREGRIRRAKLYYLRGRYGKAAKVAGAHPPQAGEGARDRDCGAARRAATRRKGLTRSAGSPSP